MKQFFKLHTNVLRETQNIVHSCIVALIVSMAKGKNECVAQKTWMAKQLYISRATFERNVKALEQMGLIQTETTCIAVNGEPKTTTHFTITEKLQNLIGQEEIPHNSTTLPLTNGNEKPIEKSQQNQQRARVKNMYDVYDEIMAKMTKEGLA